MIYYLAAKYSYRSRAQMLAHQLKEAGHEVRARWLTLPHDGLLPVEQAAYATEDLEDIDACEMLICCQFPCADPEPSTGRHIEYGYALAKGKSIILLGPRTSVFHWLPEIQHFPTLEAFLEHLQIVLERA